MTIVETKHLEMLGNKKMKIRKQVFKILKITLWNYAKKKRIKKASNVTKVKIFFVLILVKKMFSQ